MRRPLGAGALALVVLALSSCSSGQARSATSHNPLAGQSFFVNPQSPAARQVAELKAAGRTGEAAAIERIATQPTATWFTGSEQVGAEVRALTLLSSAAHRSALLVAYDIPDRDCGGYSAGGAPSAAAYRRWIGLFASGIGERPATVVLEPDAVVQAVSRCLPPAAVAERYGLLAYAIATLRRHRHTTVYLDAGNPGWITRPSRLATPLRQAGIAGANGFALNVANFYATPENVAYGQRLSAALGGSHFVIDTGRNGNGPYIVAGRPTWCNPPGRALGATPTTAPGGSRVDAYLWIKQPGASDGSCRAGAPAAGAWWPQFALELTGSR